MRHFRLWMYFPWHCQALLCRQHMPEHDRRPVIRQLHGLIRALLFASNTSVQVADFKLDASRLRCCAEPGY